MAALVGGFVAATTLPAAAQYLGWGDPGWDGGGVGVSIGFGAPGVYEMLFGTGERLVAGLRELVERHGVTALVQGVGPVFQVWFSDRPIRNYRDAAAHARPDVFRLWWQEMLRDGILFHPSQFENLFVSTAHTDDDVELTLASAAETLREVRPDLIGDGA